MMTFKVGDKVLVWTGVDDPVHLECSPNVVVTEVLDRPDGRAYYVGHPAAGDFFPQTRFGPFPAERLSRR